jgi:hypothetical protein
MPSSRRKWRLVFLIPEQFEGHWNNTQDIDFGDIKPKHQWVEHVEQFVAVLTKRYASILALQYLI